MSVETITKFSEIISPINKINEVIINHNDLDIEVENLDPWPPIGFVIHHSILLPGFVKANGAEVNREDYPRLVTFATENNLWTETPTEEPFKYGVGNGSTTMILPDYRNRFIQGGDSCQAIQAGLPDITGQFRDSGYHRGGGYATGAFYNTLSDGDTSNEGASRAGGRYGFAASRSNSIYGASQTVTPPSIQLLPQIKY